MNSLEQIDGTKNWLSRLGEQLQLDRPLLYALAAKCWQAISGPISLILIVTAFTVSEQGVYYALVTIVGIQAIFELGLLNVLISQAGSEHGQMAKSQAMLTDAMSGSGDHDSIRLAAEQRLAALARGSQRWFAVTAVLYVLAAWAFGYWKLSAVETSLDWLLPLAVVVPIAAFSIALAPSLAILEGAGFRDAIYRYRLLQIMTGSFAVWGSLLAGLQLWTLVAATLVQALWAAYVVYIRFAFFFRRFRNEVGVAESFSWSRDVVPMQWRAALISVAHFLASQMFVLVVLGRESDDSAEGAGRLGPTLMITNAVQMLALAWVQTKFPVVASQHGVGNREQAGTLWRRTALVSTGLLCAALSSLILVLFVFSWIGRGWELNFVEPWQLAMLGLGFIANHLLAIQSFYVMARRANPFWIASVTGLLITAGAVWYFGTVYSTSGLVIAYASAMCLVALPLHTWTYLRFRREI